MPLSPELVALGDRWLPDVSFERNERIPVADGLRLSNPCGACRILDHFDGAESRVTPGVNAVGHMYADWFIETLLKPAVREFAGGEQVLVEPLFDWGAGVSGLDSLVLLNCCYRAHFEFKTSSKKNPTPTKDNREQVMRQRVNIARNLGQAYDEIPPSVIYIIGKSGHFSGYVYGPFHIQPSAEEYAAAERDIDLTCAVYRDCSEDGTDPREHPLIRQLQRDGCYQCFPIEIQDANDKLRELVDLQYHATIDSYEEAVKWYDDIREDIRKLVPPGEKMSTDMYVVHRMKNGGLKITPLG